MKFQTVGIDKLDVERSLLSLQATSPQKKQKNFGSGLQDPDNSFLHS
jgi:hypothetical protein